MNGDRSDPIRVLIADQHMLFRETLRQVLDEDGGVRVVASASDGQDAVSEAARTRPDVAILDADLPFSPPGETTAVILDRTPGCHILVLSSKEDGRVLVEVLEAGASGYLTREAPVESLIEATKAISRGETFVPPRMLGPLLSDLFRRKRDQDQAAERIARLTAREREVLALLARGAGNDKIAESLLISPQTARTHVQNILGKIELHSRLEAVAFVTKHGMLSELVAADA